MGAAGAFRRGLTMMTAMLLLLARFGWATDWRVEPTTPVLVAIHDAQWSTVVLPEPVAVVTPSRMLTVRHLGPTLFEVQWNKGTTGQSEVVVFHLQSGRPIPVEFLALPQGASFVQIAPADEAAAAGWASWAQELTTAQALLRQMRHPASQTSEAGRWSVLQGRPQLRWRLVSRTQEGHLQGLELELANQGRHEVTLPIAHLQLPHLVFVEEIPPLPPCREASDPRCRRILRLVRRTTGGRPTPVDLTTLPERLP